MANVVARHDINLREPRCAPTMLTSPLSARLLEGENCRQLWPCGFAFGIGVRESPDPGPGHHTTATWVGHPDAWVPATQLKGHDEHV
jgi:hypothetical protein